MSEEFEVILPKLGESIMNATIVQWFKKEGEVVKKDEALLEVATDKVNSEIPSPVAGVLQKIEAQVDEELNVGDRLAIILQSVGGLAEPLRPVEKKEVAASSLEEDQKDYYSPAVLRIAREKNIPFDELEKIPGTGAGARISKKDVENYVATKEKPCPLEKSLPKPEIEGIEYIKMSPLRKAIAENVTRSFYQAPHASLITEVDVTDLVEKIKLEKEVFLQKHGVKLTVTSFMALAIARSLMDFPLLNASLDKDTIVVKKFVNLGIAVSVEQGVMVPVIRECHKIPLHEIAQAIADFAQKARTNTLSPDDVQEGTMTMTNFGMTGVQIGIPIIRYPEVAIVGIGGMTKKVVVLEDDTFAVRKVVNISLTIDHRVIDGIYGCDFLSTLKKRLEENISLG